MGFSEILMNVFKNAFLRSIFLISLLAVTITPLFLSQYIVPLFYNQMMENIIVDANKLAQHLFRQYNIKEEGIKNLKPDIKQLSSTFTLERIKYFDADGKTLFSTNPDDIGKINSGEAFKNKVAKGENVYEIVSKGTTSVDGRKLSVDVAEIYLPIMSNGDFEGAFEIYYNITQKRDKLDALINRSILILGIFSAAIFIGLCFIIIYASKRDLQRIEAQNMVESLVESLEEKVDEQTEEIRFNKEISIEAIAALAEDYDDDTGKHIKRIKSYTILIATWIQKNKGLLQEEQIEEMAMASVLHDIGKLSIPKHILNKPGKLDEKEWPIMQTHAQKGAEVLDRANSIFFERFKKDSYLATARDIANFHHERFDGSGYPKGLKEEEIPLAARIVSLVDVYDALRGKRPYKKQWSHEDAYELILANENTHFDPLIVEAFTANAKAFDETYQALADD